MWERLRRFSALDSEARGLFLRAVVLLPVISVSLKTRGFRATQESLLHFRSRPVDEPSQVATLPQLDIARTQLTIRMVNAAVRHMSPGSTCLERSLALWWLLRRQGIASDLRIGARKVDNKFEAHAWVEHNGIAINEPENLHRHYASFDTAFPPPTSEPL